MQQIRFPRWGSLVSLQRSPGPVAVFKGTTYNGGRERGRGKAWEGKGGRGGERRGELPPNWGVWIRQ